MYNKTDEIELDEELLMVNVEEPASYREVENSKEWKKAMGNEWNLSRRIKPGC